MQDKIDHIPLCDFLNGPNLTAMKHAITSILDQIEKGDDRK